MRSEILFVIVLYLLSACAGFDPTSYEHRQKVLPQYEIFWTVNNQDKSINLALHVQTTGWVGFGIAELTSGSMPGSDIVIGNVKNGKGSITDHWASEFAFPNVDNCQDWKLLAASESDGYTTIEIKRLLDTKDAQDRAIVAGPNRIVVAFGDNGVDDPGYHGGNRITSELTFYGERIVPSLPQDAKFIDLRMPNFTAPNGITNYICTSFALPIDDEYSVIQIDPLIDEANIEHVHHFLAHICTNATGGFVLQYSTPGDCFSPTGDEDSGCNDLLMAWAAGGGPTILPNDVGIPMGKGATSAKWVVLEIHYDSASGVGGYIDTSGVRIWYTNTLRKYEASYLIIGDPAVVLPPIPAGSITEFETECPSDCTKTLAQDLHIWSSFPHMHQTGAQIWTTQWRNDTQIAEIGRIEFWDFNHQQTQPVNYVVKPGDRLNTHCIYDTRKRNAPTNFGLNSTDEMCMVFLGYYPRIPIGSVTCGYLMDNLTMCGEGWLPYPNPTIVDPKGQVP